MGNKNFEVNKSFIDDKLAIDVEGTQNSVTGQYVIDNNNLEIKILRDDKNVDPRSSLKRGYKNHDLFLQLKSRTGYQFNVSMNESGWTISKEKPCIPSAKHDIAEMLPKALNTMAVRIVTLPVVWVWKFMQATASLAMKLIQVTVDSIAVPNLKNPEDTNVTVGDEEE